MSVAQKLSPTQTVIRAVCLGIAAMVIVPLILYSVTYQLFLALGVCDLPVECSFYANDIALLSALAGFVAGAGLSFLLDRRKLSGSR